VKCEQAFSVRYGEANIFIFIHQAGSSINNDNNNRKLNYKHIIKYYNFLHKKLSYRPGTARCVVSVEILPIATQQCRNYCTTSPEQIEVMKLEGYSGSICNKHVHSTMTRSSRFHGLTGVIYKPTTDRVVDITCIPTTCCGEIF